MKKFNCLIIAMLLGSCFVMAQRPDRPNFDPKEMAKKIVAEIAQAVEINSAAQDSLNVVFVNFFTEMDKNRKSGERPNMDNMKKIEETRDLKVKTFLTEDQYKAYQKYMEEEKSKRKGPGGEGMQGPPPDKE